MSNWKISTWNSAISQRKLKCLFLVYPFMTIFFMFSSVYIWVSGFVLLMLEWLFVFHTNNILLNNLQAEDWCLEMKILICLTLMQFVWK